MADRNVKYPTLLENLTSLMGDLRADQSELAHLVGSTQGSVSRWGKQSVPDSATLARLAGMANVLPDDFIDRPLEEGRVRLFERILPNEADAVAMMSGLLRGVGLEKEADKYAKTLAQRLPEALALALNQPDVQASSEATNRGARSRPDAKRDPGRLQ